jgi:hypothetical protein
VHATSNAYSLLWFSCSHPKSETEPGPPTVSLPSSVTAKTAGDEAKGKKEPPTKLRRKLARQLKRLQDEADGRAVGAAPITLNASSSAKVTDNDRSSSTEVVSAQLESGSADQKTLTEDLTPLEAEGEAVVSCCPSCQRLATHANSDWKADMRRLEDKVDSLSRKLDVVASAGPTGKLQICSSGILSFLT